ncbi:MAG: VCBS repeat-containing protein, partial [Pyrinomonadaceae bacterium]
PGPVAASPAPVTSLTTPFAGLTTPQINGTWTLTIRDGGGGDTGSITASNLTLTAAPVVPVDAANDVNGDGKSDYTVVRNVGGGPGGQMRWFYNTNGTGAPTVALDWGLATTDVFLLEDFDGDLKDDITVWRSAPAGQAAFYILQSLTNTARIDTFGQIGDDPTVIGDYDGDNKTDTAVYRAGAMANDPSTWYYRGSLTPATVTTIPWGKNGDFPSPGDYDGDGKNDFVIQRNNGGGQAAFWRRNNDGSASLTVFGTPTDVIVPGDYDGDGKTDYAVVRGVAGNYQWIYLASSNSSINYITFGASASDLVTQGDYNGDGKTDVAIWRPSATPGGSFYVSRDTVSGAVQFFTFGQNGDYPVNNWNRH